MVLEILFVYGVYTWKYHTKSHTARFAPHLHAWTFRMHTHHFGWMSTSMLCTLKKTSAGVASSFKPASSAKLYASPEALKTVGYRSRSLPSHSARPQVRKSHSMRTSSTFKPACAGAAAPAHGGKGASPYAQPIRTARSHSIAGTHTYYTHGTPINHCDGACCINNTNVLFLIHCMW